MDKMLLKFGILLGVVSFLCIVSNDFVCAQPHSGEFHFENRDYRSVPPDHFGGPQGEEVPADFVLKTLDGRTIALSDYIGKKPIVLEFGSYTCPVFRAKHAGMEELYAQYGDRVDFFLIYTIEAHPQGDPSPNRGVEWVTEPNLKNGILFRQPKTEEERKDIAAIALDELNITLPTILDNMGNTTWKNYGQAPNSCYLIGLDGRVKLRQGWFDAKRLQEMLEHMLSQKIF